MVFGVSVRAHLIRTLVVTLIAFVGLVSVGLTASADSPFTIAVHPTFFRLDPQSVAESRAHALGIDVDVKCGELHVHFNWSAIPLTPTTTKHPGTLL
jgi:hypothetical protein